MKTITVSGRRRLNWRGEGETEIPCKVSRARLQPPFQSYPHSLRDIDRAKKPACTPRVFPPCFFRWFIFHSSSVASGAERDFWSIVIILISILHCWARLHRPSTINTRNANLQSTRYHQLSTVRRACNTHKYHHAACARVVSHIPLPPP